MGSLSVMGVFTLGFDAFVHPIWDGCLLNQKNVGHEFHIKYITLQDRYIHFNLAYKRLIEISFPKWHPISKASYQLGSRKMIINSH